METKESKKFDWTSWPMIGVYFTPVAILLGLIVFRIDIIMAIVDKIKNLL
jgi:hypothetical protein